MMFASDIYINSQGRQWGPYSAKEAGFLMAKGAFSATDWAWVDSGERWQPLAEVLKSHQPTARPVEAEIVSPPKAPAVVVKKSQRVTDARWLMGWKLKAALLVMLVIGVGYFFKNSGELEYDQLDRRNGVAFAPGVEEPFEGQAMSYYPDGKPMYSAEFKGGKEEMVISWYDNGRKQSEASMKGGKFHGQVQYWYENGKLMANYTYENGHVVKRQDWDPDGNMYKRK